jgi:hypothetical protein
VAPLALLGCVTQPIVSDFNGSSVKLQEAFGGASPKAETKLEAGRICGKVGKKAEFASYRNLPDYNTEYLYLCL